MDNNNNNNEASANFAQVARDQGLVMQDDEGTHTNDLPHDDPLFQRKPLRNPSGLTIDGVSTPAAQTGVRSEVTPCLTEHDIEDKCIEAIGAPVISEHLKGEVFGRVVEATPDEQGKICVKIEFEDSVKGWGAHQYVKGRLERGEDIGLSWNMRSRLSKDSKLCTAVTEKIFCELSITDSPEFEEAMITAASDYTSQQKRRRGNLVRRLCGGNGQARSSGYAGRSTTSAAYWSDAINTNHNVTHLIFSHSQFPR